MHVPVSARVSTFRICFGQSGTGTGFLRVLPVRCQYHSTVALILIYSLGDEQ
jgi:hypothetical protein